MTTSTDQFIDIARRSQGAVSTVVRSWADTAQSFIGNLTDGQGKLPDVHAAVDTYFDFAAKVLTNQREIAHQWITAAQKVTEAVTEQVSRAPESLTAHGGDNVQVVAESAAETARVAGQKAVASSARTIAKP
jgi:hypothetical protein